MRKASSRNALLMPNLSFLFLAPELLLFRSSIFRTVTSRALSISVNREHPCASRNPVGKLIRSDNPEEFDMGLHPLAPVLFFPPELIRAIYASDYR